MILFPNTRIVQSFERPVAVGSTVSAEGTPLIGDWAGGVFGVKPTGGGATDQFVGVSINQQLTPLAFPNFEDLVANSTPTVTLSYTPIGGSIRVYDVTNAVAQTAGNPTNVNEYSISGVVITLHSAKVGATIRVSYRYVPTTVQAIALQGNIPPGGAAGLTLGSVGVITEGDVWTSEFDTAVDWTANPTIVKLGANGLFTVGGSGATVPNAYIVDVPTTSNAWLGIHIGI